MAETRRLSSDDIKADFQNQTLTIVGVLSKKLRDEIIARLSELAQQKVGRLNFHFASIKLCKFNDDVRRFTNFIEANRFCEKRNYDISHRELPEQWDDHKFIWIPYKTLLRGIVLAVRLMKKIDRYVIGPAAPYLWRGVRKKRYTLTMPPRVTYMILPHYLLSEQDYTNILNKEMEEQDNII
ncbi:MAG: hypothetical protein HY790_09045 [Deltaproteobacteria bacterium]|nr:hypothetical protein [Deltaproteobacteria bacterium]MBI4795965.1 hypothetical protein [Deltaproteobacteria bacterium]